MKTYRIVIVEDEPEILARLSGMIEADPEFKLVHADATLTEARQSLLNFKPDILLTDICLPDGSGIDLIKMINEYSLDCEAMIISGFSDEHTVFEALQAGAKSYILKQDKAQKITTAIHSMINGGAPISPVIARLMLKKFQRPQITDTTEILTSRQQKILHLVSQGFSSKEIAEKLNISYYTVTTHIKNIYNKLQVNSRTEALYEANRLGIISDT